MTLSRVLIGLLLFALLAALAFGLATEHQARLKLAAQHQELQQALARMAELAAGNQRLSNRLAQAASPGRLPPAEFPELLRLRGAAGMLRQLKQDLDAARKENDQVHAWSDKFLTAANEAGTNRATNFWPQNSWTNAGYTSPESTLQTVLWAGNNGDVTNFLASASPDWIKDLTNKPLAQISAEIANETYDLRSIRLLGENAQDENTMVLTLETEGVDDFHTINLVMKRFGNQWLYAGPQ